MRFIKKCALLFAVWLDIKLINKKARIPLTSEKMNIFKVKNDSNKINKGLVYKNKAVLVICLVLLVLVLSYPWIISKQYYVVLLISMLIFTLAICIDIKLDFDKSSNTLTVYKSPCLAIEYEPIYKIPVDIIIDCTVYKRSIGLVLKMNYDKQEIIDMINESFLEFPELEEYKIRLLEAYEQSGYTYDGIYTPFGFKFYRAKYFDLINDFLAGEKDFICLKLNNVFIKAVIALFVTFYVFILTI